MRENADQKNFEYVVYIIDIWQGPKKVGVNPLSANLIKWPNTKQLKSYY